MHRALRELASLVERHSEESFVEDRDAVAAAAMYLLTIGESANKLSDDSRASVPETPWRKIIDLRHRLAHGYYRQDARQLWRVAVNNAPELARSLPPLPPLEIG